MTSTERRMHEDRELLLANRVIDTLLDGDPAEVAGLPWRNPDRMRAVVEHIAHASTAPATGPMAALGHAVVSSGRLVLLDALACLGIDEGLQLFEQANLLDLSGRWALVRYLLSDPSFLTLDELVGVLDEFADNLEDNRLSFIHRGVPRTSLGASWPAMLLAYLYPTKAIYRESQTLVDGPVPASIRDRALKHLPVAKRATREHTYWWLRAEPLTSGEDWVLQEPYYEAARIPSLDEQNAARVEAGREAFLDLEAKVLRTLVSALRTRDAKNVWPRCLPLLTEALTADDAAFYLQMDQWCYGYDIASGNEKAKGICRSFLAACPIC